MTQEPNGVLIVNKHAGVTSHHIVGVVHGIRCISLYLNTVRSGFLCRMNNFLCIGNAACMISRHLRYDISRCTITNHSVSDF